MGRGGEYLVRESLYCAHEAVIVECFEAFSPVVYVLFCRLSPCFFRLHRLLISSPLSLSPGISIAFFKKNLILFWG